MTPYMVSRSPPRLQHVPFELLVNSVPTELNSCNTTSAASEFLVDSTILYAFSVRRADEACGKYALALPFTVTYNNISLWMFAERSRRGTTPKRETKVEATTPLAFLPIPKSSILLSDAKKVCA